MKYRSLIASDTRKVKSDLISAFRQVIDSIPVNVLRDIEIEVVVISKTPLDFKS